MSNVAILTFCHVDGDAVSNDVNGMCAALRRAGYNTQIFAEGWTALNCSVRPASEIETFIGKDTDIIIYHYSVGWSFALELLKTANCHKVIRYHNVTPPEFFDGINIDFFNACSEGRNQLKALAEIPDAVYLCDSEYNLQDLKTVGIDPVRSAVLPPFHHTDQAQSTEADLTVLDRYLDNTFNILMVGRVAPNKGHAYLIDAFNLYYKNYNTQCRLLIVGKEDPRLETYNRFLQSKVSELGLGEAVVFTGGVTIAALKSYYLIADVFMITSEHEGFCVPLIEAMSNKIPIVAYGSTAIPGTVGGAGLVWEQPDPHLLAGSLHHLATHRTMRHQLGELGWKRYQETFSNDKINERFIEFIQSLLN